MESFCFGLLFWLASLFVDTLIKSFFFFYAKIARSSLNLWCVTVFFSFFHFVFIRCFFIIMISSSFCYVSFHCDRERKKNVFIDWTFLRLHLSFLFSFYLFFFSLSLRSRSDIYFSIAVYEDRLYHGLSVLARFTFCASECFSPSLSLFLSLCPTMVSFHPPDTQSNFDATPVGRSNWCLCFGAINLRCGSIDQSYRS